MSNEPIYEYRVLAYRPGRHFPKEKTFRSDEAIWKDWKGTAPDPEDGQVLDFSGLSGVLGIAEATAREEELDGAKVVVIERREVSPWEQIQRIS